MTERFDQHHNTPAVLGDLWAPVPIEALFPPVTKIARSTYL